MLEVALPRHLDSSLVDVDVHPTWISLVIKAKVLRLKVKGCVCMRRLGCPKRSAQPPPQNGPSMYIHKYAHELIHIHNHPLKTQLPAEVRVSASRAQRSKTTGHLLVTMPKARFMRGWMDVFGCLVVSVGMYMCRD